jgi:ABC-2 type transport system permease protein
MNELWNKREKNYLIKLLHYAKYVLNDYFVIALLFFMGGLAFYYSNLIKSLPTTPFWWERPVIILWLLVWLQFGRLATLLQPADKIFLAAAQYKLGKYLKKAFTHSLIVASWWQVVGWVLIIPLLIHGLSWSWWLVWGLLVQQLLLKLSWLASKLLLGYQWTKKNVQQSLVCLILPFISLTFLVYFHSLVWLFLPLAVIFKIGISARQASGIFNWQQMIQNEQRRLQSLYRLINLFIDVPQIKGKVYRLKWLDHWLPSIKKSSSIYSFLFLRSFLRRSEYSALFLRLLILAGVVQVFLHGFWMSLLVILVFVYLIGFQQFPLYFSFEDNVFTYLYPVDPKEKYLAFKDLNWRLMLLAGSILIIISQLFSFGIRSLAVQLISVAVEIWLLNDRLLVSYLKKRT